MVWTGEAHDRYAERVKQATALIDGLSSPLDHARTVLLDYADAVADAQRYVASGKQSAAQLDALMAQIGATPGTRQALAAEPMRRWEDLRATTGFLDWIAELGLDVGSIRATADSYYYAAADAFTTALQTESQARERCVRTLQTAGRELPDFTANVDLSGDDVLRNFDPLLQEAGEARNDPSIGLAGDRVEPDRMPADGADGDVSAGLADLRGAATHAIYIDGADKGTPYFGDEVGNFVDRAAWISSNRQLIEAAADRYGIPADLLAGIAWQEVSGKGRVFDDTAGTARHLASEPWSPIAPSQLPDRLAGTEDETSYGPLSIQTRRAAEVLGYDPQHLTQGQRDQVVASLNDPTQNLYIAAAYLRSLKEHSSAADVPPGQLTAVQYQEIAARYNGGPYWQSTDAQGYGRGFMNNLPDARSAMKGCS